MIKVVLSICASFLFGAQIFCQSEKEITEPTKLLLFSSIEHDGNGATRGTLDQWLSIVENHFEYLEVESSSITSLFKPGMTDSISSKYLIQMYKLPNENSENQSRYLMWYKDFSSEVWLRIGGYIENDLPLLFDYLRGQKINKRQLRQMVQKWSEVDEIFKEIAWGCLFKGYLTRSTRYDCYRAVFYITLNDTSIGFNRLNDKELNSTFSRIPLYGRFR